MQKPLLQLLMHLPIAPLGSNQSLWCHCCVVLVTRKGDTKASLPRQQESHLQCLNFYGTLLCLNCPLCPCFLRVRSAFRQGQFLAIDCAISIAEGFLKKQNKTNKQTPINKDLTVFEECLTRRFLGVARYLPRLVGLDEGRGSKGREPEAWSSP